MKIRLYRKRKASPRTFPLISLAFLSLAPCVCQAQQADPKAPTPQTPVAQPAPVSGPVIGEIIVVGNKTLSSTAIILYSGHKVGDPCNNRVTEEMKENLLKTDNFGLRHPDKPELWVQVSSEQAAGSDKCKVTITVDENDKVTDSTITGSGPIKIEDIKAVIQIGSVFNQGDILKSAQAIRDLYNKKGYLVSFGNDLGPDPDHAGVLLIPINVVRVSSITFAKKHKTKDYVIRREMKTKVGDYYNKNTLQNDLRRLYNLDLFENIEPAINIGAAANTYDIVLSITEKRTGTVSVGVGYSNRQQLIGRAELGESNFGGRGEALNLLWETGGVSGKSSVELGYTRPHIDRNNTTATFNIYDKVVYRFSNTLQNSTITNTTNAGTDTRYNEQHTGGTITLSRPFKDTFRYALTFRGENVKTNNLEVSGVNTEIIQNGPIYSLTNAVLHDTRDLILDPVAGGYQNASFQVGHANLKQLFDSTGKPFPQSVVGSINFGKGSFEFRSYYSLQGKRKKIGDEKSSLAFRFLIGSGVGTLPFFEQFFVGGAETLRGYREDRYWGSHTLLGSVELRQPLARRLKGVLFLDAGDAWGGSFSNVNLNGFAQTGFKPHVGVGLGIRVGTPLGPIRLDYGYGDEGGRTHFSIGNSF